MNLLNGLQPHELPKPTKRKKHGWIFAFLGIFMAGIAGAGAIAAYGWWGVTTPMSVKDETAIPFVIERGEGAKQIAAHLMERGLIRRREFFEYYVWLKQYGTQLKAGEYALRRDMNITEMAGVFVAGMVVPNDIAVTFPEGFGVKDMDKTLADAKLVEAGEFSAIAKAWEGYLFPDTYRFRRDASATSIRDTLIANFKKKWTAAMRQDAAMVFEKNEIDCDALFVIASDQKERGDLFHGADEIASVPRNDICQGEAIVILASIIEKEVRTQDDMKTVSGILWNRLKIDMPLQVDASIVYVTGKKTGEVTYDDLQINSPYNTYRNRGLPPAPIANPGLNAIMAAIYPTETDYLYYLSKPTGETVFSRTLQEHNAAKEKYLK
ncbi:MAG: endolytic transglycosylase MltG [bacterium]|nr:endolytic transglycosylase MltG [bacterium]